MTVNKVKAFIEDLTKEYFSGAHVVWAGQSMVHRGNPTVMLRIRNIQTAPNPVTKYVDGDIFDSYPATAQLEINLFTDGRMEQVEENMIMPRKNTAVHDLNGFQIFLRSEYVQLKNSKGNVFITPLGPINDVSAIRDNTEREYSAMQEYTVHFAITTQGFAGVMDASGSVDNSSGGAPEKLQRLKAGCFDSVKIE